MRSIWVAVAACAGMLLAACDDEQETSDRASSEPTEYSTLERLPSTCSPGMRGPARPDQVKVFFVCADDGSTRAFTRHVARDAGVAERLRTALTAYFDGPKPREGSGLSTAFHTDVRLHSASLEGDRAVVDVDLGAHGATSAQSALILRHLRALAFQFPQVRLVEPRFNGSCADFGSSLELDGCLVAKRGGGFQTS